MEQADACMDSILNPAGYEQNHSKKDVVPYLYNREQHHRDLYNVCKTGRVAPHARHLGGLYIANF